MKNLIILLLLSGFAFSCNTLEKEAPVEFAPVDELIQNWVDNWNNHDSIGVRNMFLDNAILIENKIICKNAEEFATKWIHPNIRGVHTLKASKIQEWSTIDRAGYVGTYQVEVVHDSIDIFPKGAFTVNWVKTENNEWKITSAVIHAFNP